MAPSHHYPDKPQDVYLFGTCLIDLFHPEAGLDTVALLEREGIAVHFPPDQTCCGQPAYTSGYPEDARPVARLQMQLFPQPWPVIVPSGSCAGMIRHGYPLLFAADPEYKAQAEALAERVFELSEFLVHVAKVNWHDQGAPTTVAVHTSCAARREMNVHLTTGSLLAQLGNVTVLHQAREVECCGFGGTFSLKHPDISSAMAAEKVEAIRASGAQELISADCGCLFNINHTLAHRGDQFQGSHLASFLKNRIEGNEP